MFCVIALPSLSFPLLLCCKTKHVTKDMGLVTHLPRKSPTSPPGMTQTLHLPYCNRLLFPMLMKQEANPGTSLFSSLKSIPSSNTLTSTFPNLLTAQMGHRSGLPNFYSETSKMPSWLLTSLKQKKPPKGKSYYCVSVRCSAKSEDKSFYWVFLSLRQTLPSPVIAS